MSKFKKYSQRKFWPNPRLKPEFCNQRWFPETVFSLVRLPNTHLKLCWVFRSTIFDLSIVQSRAQAKFNFFIKMICPPPLLKSWHSAVTIEQPFINNSIAESWLIWIFHQTIEHRHRDARCFRIKMNPAMSCLPLTTSMEKPRTLVFELQRISPFQKRLPKTIYCLS